MNTFVNVKNLILIALFILTALAFQIEKRAGSNRIIGINLSQKTDSVYFKTNLFLIGIYTMKTRPLVIK